MKRARSQGGWEPIPAARVRGATKLPSEHCGRCGIELNIGGRKTSGYCMACKSDPLVRGRQDWVDGIDIHALLDTVLGRA